eukprot:ANDGO_04172.mRNA.1 WD repeat containing protein
MMVASCGGDPDVLLWTVGPSGPSLLRRLSSHNRKILSVRFSNAHPDLLVSGGFDATVKLWDVRSRSPCVQTITRTDAVVFASFDALEDNAGSSVSDFQFGQHRSERATDSSSRVASTLCGFTSVSLDGAIAAHDIRQMDPFGKCVIMETKHPVVDASFVMLGRAVCISNKGSVIRVVDRTDGAILRELQGHSASGDLKIPLAMDEVDFAQSKYSSVAEDQQHRNKPTASQPARTTGPGVVYSGSQDGAVWTWDLNILGHASQRIPPFFRPGIGNIPVSALAVGPHAMWCAHDTHLAVHMHERAS